LESLFFLGQDSSGKLDELLLLDVPLFLLVSRLVLGEEEKTVTGKRENFSLRILKLKMAFVGLEVIKSTTFTVSIYSLFSNSVFWRSQSPKYFY